MADESGDQFHALVPDPLEPGTAEWSNPANIADSRARLEEIRRTLLPESGPASNPEVHDRDHHQVTDPPGSTSEGGPGDAARPATPPIHHDRRTPPPTATADDADDADDGDDGPELARPPF